MEDPENQPPAAIENHKGPDFDDILNLELAPDPPMRQWHLNPPARNKEILAIWFEVRPTCQTHDQALGIIARELHVSKDRASKVITKALAKEEAKIQRREYADKIYEEKIPYAQMIVGKSLRALNHFLTDFKPKDMNEALGLSRIATDVTRLLRLELGQATDSIELIQKTEKSVTVIVDELKKNDPFGKYGSE